MTEIDLATWELAARYYTYKGHKIAWWNEGEAGSEKPTLLLIHGFPTASWDWYKIWADLVPRFHLIAIDMIGFGFSDKPMKYPYSILDQADIIEAVVREAGVNQFHILAHDYGDTVAQELSARAIDGGDDAPKISSCCFLNGGLFPETHRATFMQKRLAGLLGVLLARIMNAKSFAHGLSGIFGENTKPSAQELSAFWAMATTRGDLRRIAHALLGYMKERKQHRERWVGALTGSPVPIMVIDGAADPISGAHMVDRYRKLVTPSRTVLLEGIGHYPHVEAPAAVLEAFLEFNPGFVEGIGICAPETLTKSFHRVID